MESKCKILSTVRKNAFSKEKIFSFLGSCENCRIMRTCLKRVFLPVLRTKTKKKDHESFHGLLVPVAGVEPASVISFCLGE